MPKMLRSRRAWTHWASAATDVNAALNWHVGCPEVVQTQLRRVRISLNAREESGVPTLGSRYRAVRSVTCSLAASMSAEDQMVQSCPESSPMKWHQAHTTWFFEAFVLRPFLPDYKPFCGEFRWLFNSYYNSLGVQIPDKRLRASLSRPSLAQILAFRAYVDQAMETLLEGRIDDEAARLIILGLNHEQQHQESILTDMKHA